MPDLDPSDKRVSLSDLSAMHARGERFAMLTAYDYPTAVEAQAAGVPTLLIGDSAGAVVLGHPTTREVSLEFLLTISSAVRRGAPNVFLAADIPYLTMKAGGDAVIEAGRQFLQIGVDAIKIEVDLQDLPLVSALGEKKIPVIAHLGLRPQQVTDPSGYRVQAREPAEVQQLITHAQAFTAAGAAMLLLEAVPPAAAESVVKAVEVPVIGCGAGPACSGHVVVTHDMLGIGRNKPPRFVPVYEGLSDRTQAAMREWVAQIADGRYPAESHLYRARKSAESSPSHSS